jgi:MFS family permease
MIRRHGWRMSFWEAAAATGALALIWFYYVRDHPADHSSVGEQGRQLLLGESNSPFSGQPRLAPWRLLLTNRNLMSLTLGYFTAGYFQYIFYFWTYYYLATIRHMGADAGALATTALFLVITITTPFGGWISDRLCMRFGRKVGRRAVGIVGFMSAALLLYLATRLTAPISVATAVSMAMGLAATTEGPFWASAIDIGGSDVGAACGILNAGGNAGGFLAPLITPLVASFAGWQWGLYLACLIACGGTLMWLLVDPTVEIHARDGSGPTAESLSMAE